MKIETRNPLDNSLLIQYALQSKAQVLQCIESSRLAFESWTSITYSDRGLALEKIAQQLRKQAPAAARLMALEMGKPLAQGLAEVEKCAKTCEYYGGLSSTLFSDRPIPTEHRKSYVTYQPLGVILGVMPWNFPFWQVVRFLAPTLLAGNTILLKHAANTTGSALLLDQIVSSVLPPHVFQTLVVDHQSVESLILPHPAVQGMSLTGSTEAGRKLGAIAVGHLKKCVLELGGSDPYLVLQDADLEFAAQTCVNSRLINSGQSCIAAKRFIVDVSIAEDFEGRVVELMKAAQIGDPLVAQTAIGPLARHDLRDHVHALVDESVKNGAQIALGGFIPAGPGAFYPPTVLLNVKPGQAAFDREIFGPVASIVRFNSEREALSLANHSPFGLGAAIFSKDVQRVEEMARTGLNAGSVFVNALVQTDPRLPFGGIKQSGFGRELSELGAFEFVNVKTVVLA